MFFFFSKNLQRGVPSDTEEKYGREPPKVSTTHPWDKEDIPSAYQMQVDSVMMHVEDLYRRCEEFESHPLFEDVQVSVIAEICPRQLKEYLEVMYLEENK